MKTIRFTSQALAEDFIDDVQETHPEMSVHLEIDSHCVCVKADDLLEHGGLKFLVERYDGVVE